MDWRSGWLSFVSGLLGGAVAFFGLTLIEGRSARKEHLRVQSLEVVGPQGVVARISSSEGAGSILLFDPQKNAIDKGAFFGVSKVQDGVYGLGVAVPGHSPAITMRASPSGSLFLSDGDGNGDSLELGVSSQWREWWITGTIDDPEEEVFRLKANKRGATLEIGEMVDGQIKWIKK